MLVDDRLAIIGSANINERSQRGDRDSELACVIRDHDMIDSTMAGKPYKVGKFAHTLRMRLMREHLGVDVDELEANERKGGREESDDDESVSSEDAQLEDSEDEWDPDQEQSHNGLKKSQNGIESSPADIVDVPTTRQNFKSTVKGLANHGDGTTQEMGHQIKDSLKREGKKEKSRIGRVERRGVARVCQPQREVPSCSRGASGPDAAWRRDAEVCRWQIR